MITYPLILKFIRRGIGIILFCGLAATFLGWYLSSEQTPIYRTSASFIISPTTSEGNLDFGDLVYGIDSLSRRNTVATYAEVFGSNRVFDLAADSLNISAQEQAKYKHNAVVLPETSIIRVTVDGIEPQAATNLVNEMSKQAVSIMEPLYSAYDMTSLDIAKVPVNPISPNPVQDTLLAGIIGLLLGITIAIMLTPEIVSGRPEKYLTQKGIEGGIAIDPVMATKMRQKAETQGLKASSSGNGMGKPERYS